MHKRYLLPLLLLAGPGYAQSTLVIRAGANMVVAPGTTLIANNVRHDGAGSQLTNNADLFFSGNFEQLNGATYSAGPANWIELNGSATQTLSGDGLLTFPRLRINNADGPVQLLQDVAISDRVLIQAGKLDLNGRNVDLGTTGTLVEDRQNNRLVIDQTALNESNKGGYVRVSNRATAADLAEVGGTGIFLANAGTVSLDRYHYQGTDVGEGAIRKNYEVTGTPTDATMRIEFAVDELAGTLADEDLKLFRFNGTIWENQGGTWTDDAVNYVELTGIAAFSPWTVGSASTPLPITLLRFEALRQDARQVLLTWTTTSETNNLGFEVELSGDAQQFRKIAFVEGAGNSQTLRDYALEVTNASAAYYRLKQLDTDGAFSYSPVRFVAGGAATLALRVYPNPNQGRVVLSLGENVTGEEPIELRLTDLRGRTLWQQKTTLASGNQSLNQVLTRSAAGAYFLQVTARQALFVEKLVVH